MLGTAQPYTEPSDNGRLSGTSAVASTAMLMVCSGHVNPLTRQHARSTVTESEHPASTTTGHSVHIADLVRIGADLADMEASEQIGQFCARGSSDKSSKLADMYPPRPCLADATGTRPTARCQGGRSTRWKTAALDRCAPC